MKHRKRLLSMIICCMMLLTLCSPAFAVGGEKDVPPTLSAEEMDILHETELTRNGPQFYPCPNCPAMFLAYYCGPPRAVSHQTSCKGGCVITWYTASYWYQCTVCGYVKPNSKVVGHYCRLDHSVCADVYWCLADVRL